jgi:hypothetical protein
LEVSIAINVECSNILAKVLGIMEKFIEEGLGLGCVKIGCFGEKRDSTSLAKIVTLNI